ncbi:MAG: hypothetical protein ACLFPA_12575 [Dichotomicrobium sp.]
MTEIIPIKLKRRPWPARLWHTYRNIRALGYSRRLALLITWNTQRPRLS